MQSEPGERVVETVTGGRLIIAIDPPELQATLTLWPDGSGVPFREEDIHDLLARLKLTVGIDAVLIREVIGRAIQTRGPVEDVVIARGYPAVPGQGASLSFPPIARLRISGLGSQDPADICVQRVVNVYAGESVAHYHALEEGLPGVTLRGVALPVGPVSDHVLKAGASVDWQGCDITARTDGRLMIHAGYIEVEETLQFEGDLKRSFGDIDFVGSMVVGGSIEAGVNVRCAGDIAVGEAIVGATVYCGGDLTVGRGIGGADETIVEVRGNLEAEFAEKATLRVWGACHIRETFSASRLLCSADFTMTAGQGHFVSGSAAARDGMRLRRVGLPSGTKVRLSAGRDGLAKARCDELAEIIARLEERHVRIEEIEQQTGPMTRIYQALTVAKQEEIELLLEQLPRLRASLQETREEYERLEKRLLPRFDTEITVLGRVHPDATIEFPLQGTQITKVLDAVTFRSHDTTGMVEEVPAA